MSKISKNSIVIIIGANPESGRPDEREGYEQAEAIAGSLQRLGFASEIMHVNLDLSVLNQLKERHVPFVFNLVEEIEGNCRLAHLAPAMLEAVEIPFSGTKAESYSLTSDKIWAKKLLRLAGLPTPAWSQDGSGVPSDSKVIIKSVDEDASFGIDDDSVLPASHAAKVLREKTQKLGGKWFAEVYLDGREFNLSVLEIDGTPTVLPIAEMEFHNYPTGLPRIMSYASKWEPDSFAYQNTQRKFVEDNQLLNHELRRLALAAWELFGLRGYARIDFRCDAQGNPYIIEANPNPSLSPDAGFAVSAGQAGIDFDRLIALLMPKHLRPEIKLPQFIIKPEKKLSATQELNGHIQWRRDVKESDVEAVRSIISNSGFFNAEEVGIAVELIEDGFNQGTHSGYEFIIAESKDQFLGYACYSRIPGTCDSYDLYWIAVQPDLKRQGMGKQIMERVEQHVAAAGGKRLYIETAGKDLYAPTQAFYRSCGYTVAAELPDYYGPGDAQMTYVKLL